MASGFLLNQPSDTGGLSHRLAYVTNLIGLQVSRCAPTPFNRTMAVLPGFTAFRYREPSGRISRASDEAPVPGFSPPWFPVPFVPPLVPGTDWVLVPGTISTLPFGSRNHSESPSVPGTKAPRKPPEAFRYREPKPPEPKAPRPSAGNRREKGEPARKRAPLRWCL